MHPSLTCCLSTVLCVHRKPASSSLLLILFLTAVAVPNAACTGGTYLSHMNIWITWEASHFIFAPGDLHHLRYLYKPFFKQCLLFGCPICSLAEYFFPCTENSVLTVLDSQHTKHAMQTYSFIAKHAEPSDHNGINKHHCQ